MKTCKKCFKQAQPGSDYCDRHIKEIIAEKSNLIPRFSGIAEKNIPEILANVSRFNSTDTEIDENAIRIVIVTLIDLGYSIIR